MAINSFTVDERCSGCSLELSAGSVDAWDSQYGGIDRD